MEEIENNYVFQIFIFDKNDFNNFLNDFKSGNIYLNNKRLQLSFDNFYFKIKTESKINFFKLLNERTFKCIYYFEGKENLEVLGKNNIQIKTSKKTKKNIFLI